MSVHRRGRVIVDIGRVLTRVGYEQDPNVFAWTAEMRTDLEPTAFRQSIKQAMRDAKRLADGLEGEETRRLARSVVVERELDDEIGISPGEDPASDDRAFPGLHRVP